MARATDWRPLLAGTSAAQAGPGNLTSSAPIDRPVRFAAVGRPDANPPEGSATWTGPTPATWPTAGPLAAPVHSSLRADPNPHPTADLGPSLPERDDGLGRSPRAVHTAWPSRSESWWGCSSAARALLLASCPSGPCFSAWAASLRDTRDCDNPILPYPSSLVTLFKSHRYGA